MIWDIQGRDAQWGLEHRWPWLIRRPQVSGSTADSPLGALEPPPVSDPVRPRIWPGSSAAQGCLKIGDAGGVLPCSDKCLGDYDISGLRLHAREVTKVRAWARSP